jgi:hypothetical protein
VDHPTRAGGAARFPPHAPVWRAVVSPCDPAPEWAHAASQHGYDESERVLNEFGGDPERERHHGDDESPEEQEDEQQCDQPLMPDACRLMYDIFDGRFAFRRPGRLRPYRMRRGPHRGRLVVPFNEGPAGAWKVYAVHGADGGDTWRYSEITFARFDLGRLTNGEDRL